MIKGEERRHDREEEEKKRRYVCEEMKAEWMSRI